jgi:MFS family permease
MAQLGYSTLYIGIVPLFGFVTQLIGIPLAGYLSDIRIRKVMLLLCIVISIPTILLFLVPNAPDVPCELSPQRNSSFGNNTTKPAAIANLLDKNSDTGFTFFLIIFFLRGIYELFKKLSVSLITVATMTHIKDDKAKLGYYGCWGELGAGISLFVVGVLAGHIFHSVCSEEVPSYYVAFLYAAAVLCLTPLALPWMKYEYLEKRVVNNAEVKSVLYNPHYILILFICAHAGLCSAFQLRWEFWYMEQLGGSPFVMAVGGLLRRPIVGVWFVLSRAVIGKLGELNVIAISLFIFAASFAALAFAENAWLVIVYDNFQAASFVLTYASFVIHFSKAGSKASSAFFQGKLLFPFYHNYSMCKHASTLRKIFGLLSECSALNFFVIYLFIFEQA